MVVRLGLLVLGLAMVACQDQLDDIEPSAPQLYLEGVVDSRYGARVFVTTTQAVSTSPAALEVPWVTDASVLLTSSSGDTLVLESTAPGLYELDSVALQDDASYRLTVATLEYGVAAVALGRAPAPPVVTVRDSGRFNNFIAPVTGFTVEVATSSAHTLVIGDPLYRRSISTASSTSVVSTRGGGGFTVDPVNGCTTDETLCAPDCAALFGSVPAEVFWYQDLPDNLEGVYISATQPSYFDFAVASKVNSRYFELVGPIIFVDDPQPSGGNVVGGLGFVRFQSSTVLRP